MQKDELSTKLAEIGKRIEQAKQKLEQHGIFTKEHQITQGELDARYRELEAELNAEIPALKKHHEHVSELEIALLNWMNSIDYDFN